jgi:hypothetical protein
MDNPILLPNNLARPKNLSLENNDRYIHKHSLVYLSSVVQGKIQAGMWTPYSSINVLLFVTKAILMYHVLYCTQ